MERIVEREEKKEKKIKKFIIFFISSFFSILLLLTFPIQTFGQGYRTFRRELEQINKKTRWRIGPFRIFPTINFRDIGYDGNVYYQREEDNPVSDYTATLSPQVKVYFLFHNKLIFSLTENPEYVFYLKQKRERLWNSNLSPEFKLLFLKRFVISGSYSYSDMRLRASSEFDVRANELRKFYMGSLFYETPRGTAFGVSASLGKILYEDITLPGEEIYLSRLLNREERSGSFEFYYKIFSESIFFISGGYSEYKFEDSLSRWRDSYSYQAYSGVRFPIFGRIRGTFSLCYKNFKPREERKGFSGLTGNTSLDFRFKRLGLRFQYTRDINFSYWTNSIYFQENRYGSGLYFYLTRFLRFDYNFSYGEANYPELVPIPMPDGRIEVIRRKDIYRIHTGGFVLRIIRNAGIGVTANSWKRESNYFWENRNRLFVGGYITYNF